MFAYALGGSPLGFILYYSASYLKGTFGFTQLELGKYLWIPPLGWEIGYFFWGWVADRWTRDADRPRSVHVRLFVLLAVLSLFLASIPFCGDSFALVMSLLFLAMSTAAGFIIVALSYATTVYSRQSSGLIAGMGAGAWGAGVALASPMHGWLFDQKLFIVSFGLGAVIPLAGLLLWWLLSRRSAFPG
jgi:ACS family hexuronate transporter-like MFS transporter